MGRRCAEQYSERCAQLWASATRESPPWPGLQGFWQRWVSFHARVLQAFSDERETSAWNGLSAELMKMRDRLVSAAVQGLPRDEANDERGTARSFLARILKEHDVVYTQYLQERCQELKEELARALVARTAIGAYAHQARQMGEP